MEAERAGRRLLPLSTARAGSSFLCPRVSVSSPLFPIPDANLSPDGSRCHGLRWRRCRSPRSEPRSQESGGTDTATVSKSRGLGAQTLGAGGARSLGFGSWSWVWEPRLLGLELVSSGVGGPGDVICGGGPWIPEANQVEGIGWILHFLGVSDVWVPESLEAGEMGFVGPHMNRDRLEPLLAYCRCWTWPQTASSRGW